MKRMTKAERAAYQAELVARFAAEDKAKRELAAKYRKAGITARKYGGDDSYSWAVFLYGRPVVTGLSRSSVAYYKDQILNRKVEG